MQGYRPQLDSIRAIAAGGVLFTHFWLPNSAIGPLAVRLFFVLSGYLLTQILLSECNEARRRDILRRSLLADFYARRVLRIWPAYYFALFVSCIVGAGSIQSTITWHALFATNILFFLQQSFEPWAAAHLWTVAVEEQFYVLLPLLIVCAPRWLLAKLLIGGIAAAVAYRAIAPQVVNGSLPFFEVLPIASFDALAGGALLALVESRRGAIDWQRMLAWSCAAALVLTAVRLPEGVVFAVVKPFYVVPMAAVVAGASAGIRGWPGVILNNTSLVALGRISYGVYLYHLFVAAAVAKAAQSVGLAPLEAGPAQFVLLSAPSVAVAAMSWLLIERPVLSLRRHFRRATAVGPLIPAAPSSD